jgi:hypothetical protein
MLITLDCYLEFFFTKCGLPFDHVISNDDDALKYTDDEENGWYYL